MFGSLFFAPKSWLAMATMLCVSVPLTLFLGQDSYRVAYKKIRTGTLTMDTLFVMSTTTIMLVSVASLMMPLCPMMIDAALLIFGFRHLGRTIDEALRQVGASRGRFQDLAPKKVTKIVDNQRILVPLHTIVPGDYLHLNENSILPVDGVVEHGSGFILDRRITGSSKPRPIVWAEQLHAGIRITKVTESLTFRATAAMEKSHLMTLDGKITRAKLARSWAKGPLELETNRILQYFIPIVLAVALGSGLVVGYFFSWALALSCLATVLVSACPCTFGLIIPLCMKIGMQKAAARGVVFQSSAKLEASNDIQCVVFDLNGTLTEGKPGVRRYEVLPESGLSDDELLAYAKTLEQKSKHPLADAIRTTARHCAVVFNREVINDLQPHAGVAARWQDSA
jgi:Cu2+-exporting ATPase